jgi:hypothetical protein
LEWSTEVFPAPGPLAGRAETISIDYADPRIVENGACNDVFLFHVALSLC